MIELATVKKPDLVRQDSSEYYRKRYAPYRMLWIRVYIRAAWDFALYRDSDDLRLQKLAEDAEKWLFKPSKLPNSFENICSHLDLPIDKLRAYARRMTKDDVRKMEYLERDGFSPRSIQALLSDDGDDQ